MGVMIIWSCVIAFVIYKAVKRGRGAVTGFYQGRITAWKGSKPTPAPKGVKVGAALATGIVGGFLFLRGFTAGMVQGWPDGKKAGREWYDRKFVSNEPDMARCPKCRVDLAKQGWPIMHNKPNGEVCKYDWQTDPRWKRCPDCKAILIPGIDECTECVAGTPRARKTTKPAAPQAEGPASSAIHDDMHPHCIEDGKFCGNGRHFFPRTHSDAERQPAPDAPRIRLVHSTQTPTGPGGSTTQGGAVAVDTATGGDVQSVEQAKTELASITREQQAEREDAQNEVKRLEQDQVKHAALVQWLTEQMFPTPLVARATEINARYLGRIHAAKQRIHYADAMLASAKRANEQLAAHDEIRSDVQRVGMAKRSAYDI